MPNRLAHETSPYLLQHANNPVDWYPWGPEALERARAEDKPILLSVGYSACHWCHVMERESFEDPAIAALMNERFINVKVDREERPDVDELYMRAVQAFQQGRGGWPMTVFLAPDGEPFYGGTYYPPEPRGNLPGMPQLLGRMAQLWSSSRGEVDDLRARVRAVLEEGARLPPPAPAAGSRWLEPVTQALLQRWDRQHGGLQGVPKFPPHQGLAALLTAGVATDDDDCLDAALSTLDRIAQGGMYDLLGGGFARYSVDAEWRVPHFEKMLYDNAQLLPLYVEAWRLTGAERFAEVVRMTARWALDEMQLPNGGFAASQDADGDGEEGRFFVWTPAELAAALGDDDAERLAKLAGVTASGTFDGGASVLRLERPKHRLDRRERALVDRCLPRLFRARARRTAPPRDDKVITAWNGLMIRALAIAGFALNEPAWITAAERAASFILDYSRVDGRLMRTHKDGRAHVPATADDYAALALGLVDLYEASFSTRWLDEAEALLSDLDRWFGDEGGGLSTTGSDQPSLVVRALQGLGGSEPSANGLAALAWARLAVLRDRPDLGARADRLLAQVRPLLDDHPMSLGLEAIAGAWRADGGSSIAVVGGGESAARLLDVLRTQPAAYLSRAAGDEALKLPWVAGKSAPAGEAMAYLCRGATCAQPTADPEALRSQVEELATGAPARPEPIALRQPAPGLPTHFSRWLHTNTPPTPERLAGQVVVLHVFSSAALECDDVHRTLDALAQRYARRAVVVVGVASPRFPGEGDRRAVARAIGRYRLKHPVILDEDRELFAALGAKGWPTIVVIDAAGRVAWRRTGAPTEATLVPLLDALLAEDGVAADPLPAAEFTEVPDGPLAYPARLHVHPDAMLQELGADALHGGTLYVADTGHHRVLELDVDEGPDGWPALTLRRVFGTGAAGFTDGATGTFRAPHGLVRADDALFVADTGNHALRRIDLRDGQVTTLAGTGRPRRRRLRAKPRWERPREIDLASPLDVECMEVKGRLLVYIAMAGANQLWAYGMGMLASFAGSGLMDHIDGGASEAALAQPSGLALFGRYLLFTDAQTSSVRGIDLQHHHAVTVIGLGAEDHGDVDGTGDKARLQFPQDLTFIGDHLYVTDTLNHKIKRVSLATLETRTVAGGDPDVLQHPSGIERLGPFLVVADTDNHRIRAIDPRNGEIRDLTW